MFVGVWLIHEVMLFVHVVGKGIYALCHQPPTNPIHPILLLLILSNSFIISFLCFQSAFNFIFHKYNGLIFLSSTTSAPLISYPLLASVSISFTNTNHTYHFRHHQHLYQHPNTDKHLCDQRKLLTRTPLTIQKSTTLHTIVIFSLNSKETCYTIFSITYPTIQVTQHNYSEALV